jgi:hypothetical protein
LLRDVLSRLIFFISFVHIFNNDQFSILIWHAKSVWINTCLNSFCLVTNVFVYWLHCWSISFYVQVMLYAWWKPILDDHWIIFGVSLLIILHVRPTFLEEEKWQKTCDFDNHLYVILCFYISLTYSTLLWKIFLL